MKTSLPKKSKPHSDRINQIKDIILEAGKNKSGKSSIAFIILFGSFARGDWVFDRYFEDGILYEYASDYDLLIITKTAAQAASKARFAFKKKIEKAFKEQNIIKKYHSHNPHYIIEPLKRVNDDLRRSQYFFLDIKKEGILLYDSGEFELSIPEELNEEKRRGLARSDYFHWIENATDFFSGVKFYVSTNALTKAAFLLHQTTESLYSAALLALTGYKPKTHDLIELNQLCSIHSNDFLTIFPLATEEQEQSFELLCKAYVEARYNKNYVITKEQLEYLITRVEKLKLLVEEVCRNKI